MFLILSGVIGKVHIKIEINMNIMRGRNQIITPCPYIRGSDVNIPINAPLEFIKLIAKTNKTDRTKTMPNFNLSPSFFFCDKYDNKKGQVIANHAPA